MSHLKDSRSLVGSHFSHVLCRISFSHVLSKRMSCVNLWAGHVSNVLCYLWAGHVIVSATGTVEANLSAHSLSQSAACPGQYIHTTHKIPYAESVFVWCCVSLYAGHVSNALCYLCAVHVSNVLCYLCADQYIVCQYFSPSLSIIFTPFL